MKASIARPECRTTPQLCYREAGQATLQCRLAVAQADCFKIRTWYPRNSATAFSPAVVELLKRPTTVALATDAPLEVLNKRMPGAPGKEAGLDATIAWVAATYPDIDLDSPPTFPATGGVW